MMVPGHPYESANIEKEADQRDISHKILSRAKKALGISSKQLGARWYSTLPPLPPAPTPTNTTGSTGNTGDTGDTGDTGYSEPKSMAYEQGTQDSPVSPVSPEYPVSPVVIRAREGDQDHERIRQINTLWDRQSREAS
jgi:hypothetical protein